MDIHRQRNIIDYSPSNKNISVTENKSKSEIKIESTADELIFKIPKNLIISSTSIQLKDLITSSLSFFINDNLKILGNDKKSVRKTTESVHYGFFMDFLGHYTGGRYSLIFQAVILSQYYPVTIVSNSSISNILSNFNDYGLEKLNVVVSENYLDNINNNNFSHIIGLPVYSGIKAKEYADKFNLPLYSILFESPNWMKELEIDIPTAEENYWMSYKNVLLQSEKIIVPSYESKKYCEKWLSRNDIKVLYPFYNYLSAKKYKKSAEKYKKTIVFSSRMAPFKNPLSIINKLGKEFRYILIGKIWSKSESFIDQLKLNGYEILIYQNISDKLKYKLLCCSSAMIFPSKFEGFGMPPMEAMHYHLPIFAYDLPVLKEIYGDQLIYSKVGDEDGMVRSIKDYFKNGEYTEYKPVNTLQKHSREIRKIFDVPEITTGTIVYNCDEYIEYSIKSLYNISSQMIIVHGKVDGYSNEYDKTKDIIDRIKSQDIYDKIEIINGTFKDKIEMQNEIAKRVRGKYYIKLDADEIWKEQTALDVITYLENNKDVGVVRMPFYHFWLSFKNIAIDSGGKWSTKHPRVWRWKIGYRHKKSFNFFQDTKNNNVKVVNPYVNEYTYAKDRIYHFGYVRPLRKLLEKINYYKNRGIETDVKDTVSDWKDGMETQPTQKGGNSKSERFFGTLPDILKNHPYKNISDIRTIKE